MKIQGKGRAKEQRRRGAAVNSTFFFPKKCLDSIRGQRDDDGFFFFSWSLTLRGKGKSITMQQQRCATADDVSQDDALQRELRSLARFAMLSYVSIALPT